MTYPSETALWASVVRQAIEDATVATSFKSAGSSLAVSNERARARAWFHLTNPDFVEVCHLAGLNPDAVIERAKAVFARYDEAAANGQPFELVAKEPSPEKPEPTRYRHNGLNLTVTEWAKHVGIKRSTLTDRLLRHSFADAIDPNFKRGKSVYTRPGVRQVKRYTINGITKTLSEWAGHAGIDYHVLLMRLRSKWPLELAVTVPKLPKGTRLNDYRGMVSNFPPSKGTGAGSVAQETPNIGISE